MKQKEGPPLPACDGMQEKRAKIHQIRDQCLTHEERGSRLCALMMESHRVATAPKVSKATLPVKEFIAPRLEELPVELIENIAVNCNLETLRMFRKASPILGAKSRHYFQRRFYTHRTIKIEYESLRRLMNVLNSEDLGSCLQDLTIIATERECEGRNPHFRPPYHRQMRGTVRFGRQTVMGSQQPTDSSSNSLACLLDRIFSRINTLRSLRLVAPPYKMANLGPEDFRAPEDDQDLISLSDETLTMVIEAIASGSTQISQIELGSFDEFARASFDLKGLNMTTFEAHRNGLKKLRSVKAMTFKFQVQARPEFDHMGNLQEWDARDTAGFPLFLLGLSPRLEVLNLDLGAAQPGSAGCPAFEALSHGCKLTNLTQCTLYGCQPSIPDLGRFFRTCKSIKVIHLRSLRLVIVGDVETGQEVVRKMFGNMGLKECTLVGNFMTVQNNLQPVPDEHWVPGFPGHWVETKSGQVIMQ
jgi:hypothetical protein